MGNGLCYLCYVMHSGLDCLNEECVGVGAADTSFLGRFQFLPFLLILYQFFLLKRIWNVTWSPFVPLSPLLCLSIYLVSTNTSL